MLIPLALSLALCGSARLAPSTALQGAARPDGAQAGETPQQALARLLLEQRRAGHGVSTPLLDEAAALAGDHGPLLMDALLTNRHPPSRPDAPPELLNRYERDLLCRALERASPAVSVRAVDLALRRHAVQELDADRAVQAELELLGAVAGPASLGRLLQPFLLELERPDPLHPRTSDALLSALQRLLARHPECSAGLGQRLAQVEDLAAVAIARALRPLEGAALQERLLSQAERRPGIAQAMLLELARLGSTGDRWRDIQLAERLVRLLEDERDTVVEAAAAALSALQATETAEPLFELLSSESTVRRGAAHRALLALAGVRLPASPDLWRDYLDGEREFERRALPELLRAALDGAAPDLARSLRSLQGHALLRHELAAELGVLLTDPAEPVRNLARVFLSELQSSVATRELRLAVEQG